MKTEFYNLLKNNIGKDIGPNAVGLTVWLNPRIESISEEGRVRLSFEARAEMLNPLGIMHGGIIAAILDEVMGFQLYLLNDTGAFVSLNLNVDFISKVKEGERVTAIPEVIRIGRSTAHLVCEIRDSENKLLAKATSNFSRIA